MVTVVAVGYSFSLDCDITQVWQLCPPPRKKIQTESVGEVSWSPVVIKLLSSNAEPRLAFVLSCCLHHVASGALSASLRWQMRGEACHGLFPSVPCKWRWGASRAFQGAAWTSWGRRALGSLTWPKCPWLPLMISLFKVSHKKLYLKKSHTA